MLSLFWLNMKACPIRWINNSQNNEGSTCLTPRPGKIFSEQEQRECHRLCTVSFHCTACCNVAVACRLWAQERKGSQRIGQPVVTDHVPVGGLDQKFLKLRASAPVLRDFVKAFFQKFAHFEQKVKKKMKSSLDYIEI